MIRGAEWLQVVDRMKINNALLLSLLRMGVLDWKAPNNHLHQATQAIRHGTAVTLRLLPRIMKLESQVRRVIRRRLKSSNTLLLQVDNAEVEWRAHTTQIHHIEADAEKHRQEVLTTTNTIEDAIQKNNVIFGEKWEMTHDHINCHLEDICLLKNRIVDLEALSGLQQNTLQSCQSTIAGLEETVLKLATSVTVLEKSVCRCRDHLLSPAPHYASGEGEVVKETEEEGAEEETEEEGLEYTTDTPSGGSYMTPPSTGGRSSPLPAPSHSPTPGDSDPENNTALCTEELEARIEVFLEEAEEDLMMDNLPLAENTSLVPVPAPVFPGIIPFAVSTGQCCVPPKHLVRKVYHPYNDPVGQCRCEPGGWCNDLPCSSRKRRIPCKIRGHSSLHGGSRLGRSCCGSSEEPVNNQKPLCGGCTPTRAPCPGSPEF